LPGKKYTGLPDDASHGCCSECRSGAAEADIRTWKLRKEKLGIGV
jgi:hypothetical protein